MEILWMSNGHGEDLNASLILQALRQNAPEIQCSAMPLVGLGNAYQKLQVKIICPTQTLPSGGIIYTNPFNWLKDIYRGLIGLIIQQIKSLLAYRHQVNFIVAVGDIVPIAFAYITGKPFAAFIVSTSAYYEGRLKLPWLTEFFLRSPRCRAIFTRDRYTEQDLHQRGIAKAIFAGYPIMDTLNPTGQTLAWEQHSPKIALLPGSRVPEALENLKLQLKLCEVLSQSQSFIFCVALVPSIQTEDLQQLAHQENWRFLPPNQLHKNHCRVYGYWDAFADILQQCDGAIGMAGTAVEQAVGLGKPVLQIPGNGPQFTYAFAEAQMRLLGPSVITMSPQSKEEQLLAQAATTLKRVLQDQTFLENCQKNGLERVGKAGGSWGIAQKIQQLAEQESPL